MKVVRGDLQGLKGVPKNGLCIGIHRAGTMHKRFADRLNHPLTIWSLRPENEFLAYDPKEFEGKGLSATGNLDEVDGSVIFGVRGAPPQVREEAAKRGLEVVADATCPYVVEQEEAALKFLEEGLNLVILSDPNHHGATRIEGIAKKMDRPLFIVEKEEDVEKYRQQHTGDDCVDEADQEEPQTVDRPRQWRKHIAEQSHATTDTGYPAKKLPVPTPALDRNDAGPEQRDKREADHEQTAKILPLLHGGVPIDFLELGFRLCIAWIHIWMMCARQTAIRLSDFSFRSILL